MLFLVWPDLWETRKDLFENLETVLKSFCFVIILGESFTARLAQSAEHETLNLRVVGFGPIVAAITDCNTVSGSIGK